MNDYNTVDAFSNLKFYLKQEDQIYLVALSGRTSYDKSKRLSMYLKIYITWDVSGNTHKLEIPIKYDKPINEIYNYKNYLLDINIALNTFWDVIQNLDVYLKMKEVNKLK